MDRVGFPEGYNKSFKQFYVFDRLGAKSVSFICGNDVATSVKSGEPFPYGSILVFESWRAKQDASGNAVTDANGHLIRDRLNAINVMRKEKGFGEAYQTLRTGEWEYVAFRPDKTFRFAPKDTAVCASCHQALSPSKERDWVFRPELFFAKDRYAQTPPVGPNEIGVSHMAFSSDTRAVKVGTTLKWTNANVDKIDHTVTALDASFDSGVLKPGASFTKTFDAPGTFQYVCAIHPEQMKASIQVTN